MYRGQTQTPMFELIAERVAIDIRQNFGHPQYITVLDPLGPPVWANKSDAVLLMSNYADFENRWKMSCVLINYGVIRYWDDTPYIDLNLKCLRRFKICRFPDALRPRAQMGLLKFLSCHTQINQLEIDTLDLSEGSATGLIFACLQLLSIDEIRVLNTDYQVVQGGQANLILQASSMQTLYLGPNDSGTNPIDHISFVQGDVSRFLRLEGLPSEASLRGAPFSNLRVLICNRYRHAHLSVIQSIACGELLPHLESLFCNHHHLKFTSARLSQGERSRIRELHKFLYAVREKLKPGLQITIHGLKFIPTRHYNQCGYHLKMIQYHFNHVREGLPILPCETVSNVEYLDALDTFFGPEQHMVTSNDLNKFYLIYLNLRHVLVENRTRRLVISVHRLLAFLSGCKALTRLDLHWANLAANFYAELVRLPSLANLNSLVILEEPGQYAHIIEFQRLLDHFRFLQNFRSNVAPSWTMFLMLAKMRNPCCFIFDFWRPGQALRRCTFWRKGELYHLQAQIENDAGEMSEFHQETFPGYLPLVNYFIPYNPDFDLYHWLDLAPADFQPAPADVQPAAIPRVDSGFFSE